jgi:two-component system sensor histidine kinase UhpB
MAIPFLDIPTSKSIFDSDSNSQKTKVLLVEDTATDAYLVRSALADLRDRELFGPVFDIRSADRLSTALTSLAEERFDVILLDLSLPDSPSFEQTFAHIHTRAANIPIIVLTGFGDELLGLKMVRDGAQDYLIKSRVERYVLVKAIRYAIERQRSERALRDSEEEFRSIVETTREWIWAMDLNGHLTYSNPAVESMLGYEPVELLDQASVSFLHPEDCEMFRTLMADAVLHTSGWCDLKLRWRHKNGSYHWLESNASPSCDAHGKLVGFRGTDRDITERENAKSAQTHLQLKLVTVQEEERHRIARELHDQLGQSLAALMLGLKSLERAYKPREQARGQFDQLHKIANDLAKDVHSLALDLRPTALDDLGLEVALSNYLEGWSSRWQISADFHSHGFTDRRLPPHLETTIYRIVQAALTNIARHAKATSVSLILERHNDRVVAIIEDDGCGFYVEAVMKNPVKEQRLGLLGMEERVALVGGALTIESTPAKGTSVYVRIPISSHSNGELAR